MEEITFYNGVKVPLLGFGTYQIRPQETKQAVLTALSEGYRLVDTAQDYYNEREVGQAVRASGISRDQIFVTTKQDAGGYERAKRDIDESLAKAGLDYFDLMIIHWPTGQDVETYRALEEAQKAGKLRMIGVSNFNLRQLQDLVAQTEIKPVLNQIETHVYLQQKKQHAWLNEHEIVHESWSPLASGPRAMIKEPLLNELGAKYHKTPVQIALRFLTQEQILTIPRSVNPDHIRQNFEIFDFSFNQAELTALRALDQKRGGSWPQAMAEDQDY